MTDSARPDDDANLVREMKQGNLDAFSSVLKLYGATVKRFLRSRFKQRLRDPEIDEAFNAAALNLWRTIGTYKPTASTLLGWFMRIAHNAAVDEWRKERDHKAGELLTEPPFRPHGACLEPGTGPPTKSERRCELMLSVIMNELKGNMRAVAMADLVSGEIADRRVLASQLGIPITQVDVTRSQMRKRVRERVFQLEQAENSRAVKS